MNHSPKFPNLAPAVFVALVCFSVTGALAAKKAAEPAAPETPAERAATTAKKVCIACHTSDGTRGLSAYPILQGQHPQYLAKQLRDIKDGKREAPLMVGFAAMLSDEDIPAIAAFFGNLPAPASDPAAPAAAPESTPAESARIAAQIWRGGIAKLNVPSCATCHSPNGMGIPAQYPRLAGQHSEYLETQLKAMRDGVRKNSEVMTGLAHRLKDNEIKALSDYAAAMAPAPQTAEAKEQK